MLPVNLESTPTPTPAKEAPPAPYLASDIPGSTVADYRFGTPTRIPRLGLVTPSGDRAIGPYPALVINEGATPVDPNHGPNGTNRPERVTLFFKSTGSRRRGMSGQNTKKRIIYVMAIPHGRVKIGVSESRRTLEERRTSLNKQYRFSLTLRYAERVPDASEIERELKDKFRSSRANVRDINGHRSKEIFKVTAEEAISVLKQIPIRGSRQVIWTEQFKATKRSPVSRLTSKSNRKQLKRSDIPKGAQLHGTYKNRTYACIVKEPGRRPTVRYKNKNGLSLTAAAKLINRYGSTSGTEFWHFGDTKISELRDA